MQNWLGQKAREETRHWLPSQGVDPAPLTELNAECLGLLAARATESVCAASTPHLLSALRRPWESLTAQAVRRLAAAPFCLFDPGIASASRWLELRGRAVHDMTQRVEPAYFDPDAARSITRRALVYAWHLSRSRPRAACLVFGCTNAAVEALAACSLTVLDTAADRNASQLRPRWPNQTNFWRELLAAASAADDQRLHDLLLGGIQRLAADSFAAHVP
jgi:hypothetical protein